MGMETLLVANEDKVRRSLGSPVLPLLTSLSVRRLQVSDILGEASDPGTCQENGFCLLETEPQPPFLALMPGNFA